MPDEAPKNFVYIWLYQFYMYCLHLIEFMLDICILFESIWDVYIWLNWRQTIRLLQTAAGEESTIQGIQLLENDISEWQRFEFVIIIFDHEYVVFWRFGMISSLVAKQDILPGDEVILI